MGHLSDTVQCIWLPLTRTLSCTWTFYLQIHPADDARLHSDKPGQQRESLYESGRRRRAPFQKACDVDKPGSPDLGVRGSKIRSNRAQDRPKVTRDDGRYVIPLGSPHQMDEDGKKKSVSKSCFSQYNLTTHVRWWTAEHLKEISPRASVLLGFLFPSLCPHSSISTEVGHLFPSLAIVPLVCVPHLHNSSSYGGAYLEHSFSGPTWHSLNLSPRSGINETKNCSGVSDGCSMLGFETGA